MGRVVVVVRLVVVVGLVVVVVRRVVVVGGRYSWAGVVLRVVVVVRRVVYKQNKNIQYRSIEYRLANLSYSGWSGCCGCWDTIRQGERLIRLRIIVATASVRISLRNGTLGRRYNALSGSSSWACGRRRSTRCLQLK